MYRKDYITKFRLLVKKDFYQQYMAILRRRKIIDIQSLAFGILHGDFESFSELCNTKETQYVLEKLNVFSIETPFYTFKRNRHLEYAPLVNARFHSRKDDSSSTTANLLNREFRE